MAEAPYLLIVSTSNLISNASSNASNRHKSKLIGIDDVFTIDAAGKVSTKVNTQIIIANWLEIALQKLAKPGSEYHFSTLASATWE
ncbi:hypothetical protein V3564_00225 [Bartonella sp. B12(2025)]